MRLADLDLANAKARRVLADALMERGWRSRPRNFSPSTLMRELTAALERPQRCLVGLRFAELALPLLEGEPTLLRWLGPTLTSPEPPPARLTGPEVRPRWSNALDARGSRPLPNQPMPDELRTIPIAQVHAHDALLDPLEGAPSVRDGAARRARAGGQSGGDA